MKKLFSLILLALITQHVQTQSGVAGYWRAVSVVPDGTPDGAILQFTMDLRVEGASIAGTVAGAPITISGGRVEGTLVTLTGVNSDNKQPISLTGGLSAQRSSSLPSASPPSRSASLRAGSPAPRRLPAACRMPR